MSDDGLIKNLKFYDNLGYEYTARFSIKSTGTDGEFTVELLNVLDGDGNTYYDPENIQAGQPAHCSVTPRMQQRVIRSARITPMYLPMLSWTRAVITTSTMRERTAMTR